MNLFCEKCCKIVPEKEVKKIGNNSYHYYETSENFYKNAGTNRVGFCLTTVPHFCVKLREPTEMEYFLYCTLNIKK